MSSGGGESSRKTSAFHVIAISLLALLCAALYANTLASPFVYDDRPNIEDNESIRIGDLHPLTLWRAGMESRCTRPVAYASFALNYYFGGFEVRGYHVVNAVVHALSGLLVYWLALDLFGWKGRRQDAPRPERSAKVAALLAAAIFIAHPIQTQSVTYVVQRMSSMATLFCLLSFVLFIQGRSRDGARRWVFWLASVLAWGLALGTKQIAMPLPALVVLYEWFFWRDLSFAWLRDRWGLLLGTVAVMGLVSSYFILSDHEISYDVRSFTLQERLLTQPRVVMLYLGLLFFPHPSRLNLLHDVPVSSGLFDPVTTLFSGLALLAVFALAIRLAPRFRLASFCVIWFFVNLAIESSFISLELMFEHRLYLPMVGFSIFAAAGIASVASETRWLAPVSLGLIALLSFGTVQRNEVWQSKLSLWQDTSAKSPNESVALNNLGVELRHEGSLADAETALRRSVDVNPNYFRAWWNLASVASDQGDGDEVIRLLERAVAVETITERADPYIAIAHRRLAKIFLARGAPDQARTHSEAALRLDPERASTMMRLAWMLVTAGDPADLPRAIELAERADGLTEHSAPKALDTLARAYAAAGRFDDAARVVENLLALELEGGGGRERVIRERLAEYRAAAAGSGNSGRETEALQDQ